MFIIFGPACNFSILTTFGKVSFDSLLTLTRICCQVVNRMIYTGSSDHTSKSWVTEFGDCTRTYKGHKHTVFCIKYYDGLSKCVYESTCTKPA